MPGGTSYGESRNEMYLITVSLLGRNGIIFQSNSTNSNVENSLPVNYFGVNQIHTFIIRKVSGY